MNNKNTPPAPVGLVDPVDRVTALLIELVDDGSPEWAEAFVQRAKSAPHAGDCPYVERPAPITCDRCVWEEYSAKARRIIATLSGQTGGAVPAVDGWRPMSEEPVGQPITARMLLQDGSWWYARVRVWRHEDGEGGRFGDHGYELLHYNGDVTMGRFYGPFHSWCEIDATLSGQTGGAVSAVDLPGLRRALQILRHPNAGMEPPDGGSPSQTDRVRNVAEEIEELIARLTEQPGRGPVVPGDRMVK